ncbi:aspartate-semialdehyde dehydrogenase [Methanosarcina mazei]|jgi:aspartate-semialdehyde dehydrogenase|uniref:aspartate-semialdehyde dehydrogenase n=5 Tax=Methanosarcina mazei TaxID=2209 RepID=A0A0F8M559_METMZ|nr:aspartate-semialdehyde dehydrogenase [Methanosarcina mazei]AGF97042.1 Aspartate-semialdehyde dehydrogenase [Methanosarcina mazei Tuc01]AKB41962.1 Aspartate-semialdehyde dehydrogenase [Methanosarcina mazei WWM610]AKB62899.1 Aspartate-semialdehyde dehydrogenase [Methanosarcina mazei SarPi]AKB72961.1 Aspartate-semialdehyde dehydrogenase [Methanosarcina mazei C16]KKF99202.1 aspartate-semialdehyde dehydrogenase [Methanosarcina mazei]
MAAVKAGILGATGAVGQRFVEALANHPWFEITALAASERSAGKTYREAAGWRLDTAMPESVENIEVVPVDPKTVDADVVFSALPADLALTVESEFAKAGFAVASNASSYRMEKDIPLVIPEVNPEHLGLLEVQQDTRGWDGYIITNPNCSTIVMTVTLKPLMQFGLETVQVATMQAISGAGFSGVAAMAIYDNVIPYIGSEEKKMETETLKLLGEFNGSEIVPADMKVSASCHRVPVVDGHTEAIWAGMRENPTPEEVREAFLKFDPELGELPSEPNKALIVRDEVDRPQPRLDRNMGKGMSVSVGRIREGIRYIAMGHNTIRGAAGASVLNAELLHSMGKL